MSKIHVVTSEKHWAINVEKGGSCPECQAANGFPCIRQASKHKVPATRYPLNTVHASRVNALGHHVRSM